MWRSFMLCMLMCLPLLTANARSIDSIEAKSIAAQFAYLHNINGTPVLVRTIENERLSETAVYVFNISESGYAVVSGNDCVQPVLAYSNRRAIDFNHLPDGLKSYLYMRADEVSFAQNNSLSPSPNTAAQWEELRLAMNGSKQKVPNTKEAPEYLISSTWDQSWPYNMYCPEIDGSNALVGCVATALSQIIRFWGHPEQGIGNTSYLCHACNERLSMDFSTATYDYENMPDQLYYESSDVEKDAVATLCYHAGVSVWMQYGVNSSGVNMSNIGHYCTRALKKNFGFDSNTTHICYRSTMSSDRWIDTIRNEIVEGRPVFYCGYDNDSPGNDAGHAFILDGYDSTNSFFHVNWGWSGSGDGWFDLYNSELNVYGYHFAALQAAVIGIQPQDTTAIPDPPDPPDTTDTTDTTGIFNVSQTSFPAISVFPNPASNTVNIIYDARNMKSSSAFTTISVYSSSGQLLNTLPVPPSDNTCSQKCIVTVDVSNFPPGIYFCSAGGHSAKFAVIK